MRNFAAMNSWSRAVLDAAGYNRTKIHPGPDLPDVPDDTLVWTRYGGPGLQLGEGGLDEISWQARCIGKQMDYVSAEGMADAIDIAMISHFSSRIGGLWVSEIRRVGGAPNPLLVDDADRTHFVCSYVVSVETALTH